MRAGCGRWCAGLMVLALAAPVYAQPRRYRFEPDRTTVTFTVRHMGVLSVTGRFEDVAGELTYDGHDPASLEAVVTVRAASVETGNRMRDRSLRSEAFLDAARFPAITFTSTRVAADGDGYRAEGRLDLHGVARTLTVPFTVAPLARGLRLEAVFTLNRRDYGLVFGPAMDALVGDEVRLMLVATAGVP